MQYKTHTTYDYNVFLLCEKSGKQNYCTCNYQTNKVCEGENRYNFVYFARFWLRFALYWFGSCHCGTVWFGVRIWFIFCGNGFLIFASANS